MGAPCRRRGHIYFRWRAARIGSPDYQAGDCGDHDTRDGGPSPSLRRRGIYGRRNHVGRIGRSRHDGWCLDALATPWFRLRQVCRFADFPHQTRGLGIGIDSEFPLQGFGKPAIVLDRFRATACQG